jgi:hypothetical protein
MNHLFTFLLLLGIAINLQAQAPTKFKYQAVARDPNNQPYSNTTLRIRFALLENSASGFVRYSEEHTVSTSALGVFEANIGGGTVLQGSLNGVLLGEYAYFLRVELNPQPIGGSFILMGTSQLLSVPYALYSAQAGAGGDQTLDLSGNELSISNGNSVQLPEYQAGPGIQIFGQQISAQDESETNELQTLSLNGDLLSISNGNSVLLPDPSFSLPYFGSLSSPDPLFSIYNTGGGAAIYASTNGGGDAAIVGVDPSGGLAGVRGYSSGSYGVLGYSDSGWGVVGQGGNVGVRAESFGGTALEAYSNGGLAISAQGRVEMNGPVDIQGTGNYALTCTGSATGIQAGGSSFGVEGYGFYGIFGATNAGGYGGYFPGRLYGQTLEKGSGSFKIDHPLDPENKYLYHSFVESPDMMNVYNGNITTDANGLAIIELPDYFETLNRDFRYQLTCIGTFAQVIVEREVSQNSFVIHSDKPNVKVSWQVTGIRQDAHANQFRIVPTVEKEAKDKGKYLCPECYDLPEQKGIIYDTLHLRDPDKK